MEEQQRQRLERERAWAGAAAAAPDPIEYIENWQARVRAEIEEMVSNAGLQEKLRNSNNPHEHQHWIMVLQELEFAMHLYVQELDRQEREEKEQAALLGMGALTGENKSLLRVEFIVELTTG